MVRTNFLCFAAVGGGDAVGREWVVVVDPSRVEATRHPAGVADPCCGP